MNFKKLDIKALKAKLLLSISFSLVILFLTIIISKFMIIPSVVALVVSSFIITMTVLRYKCYSYSYDEKRIIINSGVIFKLNIVIPICQIQDLHIYQGPIMRIFNLKIVEISTGGSNYSTALLLSNVAEEMVKDLEKHLNKRIEELKNEEVL